MIGNFLSWVDILGQCGLVLVFEEQEMVLEGWYWSRWERGWSEKGDGIDHVEGGDGPRRMGLVGE